MLKLLVLACCVFSISGLKTELPSFIPKCSLKDPNFNGCAKEKGNVAIPILVKGVEEFGLPNLTPVQLPEVKIGGKNLQVVLKNAVTDDFKKIRLQSVDVDWEKGRGNFVAFIDSINLSATYSITNGKFLSRELSGTGKFNMTLVGNKIYFKSRTVLTDKDGVQYVDVSNPSVDLQTDRAYYQFENLRSTGAGDINEFVDKNWKVLRDELEPSFEVYLLKFIYTPIEAFQKLPASKLFL